MCLFSASLHPAGSLQTGTALGLRGLSLSHTHTHTHIHTHTHTHKHTHASYLRTNKRMRIHDLSEVFNTEYVYREMLLQMFNSAFKHQLCLSSILKTLYAW